MSLLLNALKKAAEENAETSSKPGIQEVELLELDMGESANSEPAIIEVPDELIELDFDEEPELIKEVATTPHLENDQPIKKPVEAKEKFAEILDPVDEIKDEPPQKPSYGSNEHAQQIFASQQKETSGKLKWLFILLLLLFILAAVVWSYDLFNNTQPVARVGQFEVTEPQQKIEIKAAPIVEKAVIKKVAKVPVQAPKKDKPKPVASKPKISIVRNIERDSLLENLQLGFKEYQQGNYGLSSIAYSRALQQDVKNRDALLGLAANSLRQSQIDESYLPKAKSLYLKLLDLDPNDAAAQAGLAAADKRFLQTSSLAALKEAVHQRPHLAPLHYSLANKYAAQKDWSLAQTSYFNAFSLAPDHADYAFNLGVSLDKIGQSKAAIKYYQQAILLSAYRPHGIDVKALQKRMQYLQRAK